MLYAFLYFADDNIDVIITSECCIFEIRDILPYFFADLVNMVGVKVFSVFAFINSEKQSVNLLGKSSFFLLFVLTCDDFFHKSHIIVFLSIFRIETVFMVKVQSIRHEFLHCHTRSVKKFAEIFRVSR